MGAIGIGIGLPFMRWAGGTAPFSPKSIPGLTAWFDASQITGVADGTTLATWPDESGNGYNATQSTGADQPTYYKTTAGKTVNGLPAVWWDSSSDFMVTPNFSSLLTVGTLFVVGQVTAGNTNSYVLMDTNSSVGTNRWGFGPGFGTATGIQDMYQGTNLQAPTATAISPQQQWTALFAGSGTSYLRQNGTTLVSGAAGTNSLQGVSVGGTYAGGDTLWTGCICEFLIYASVLSSTDYGQVETYLQSKWATP